MKLIFFSVFVIVTTKLNPVFINKYEIRSTSPRINSKIFFMFSASETILLHTLFKKTRPKNTINETDHIKANFKLKWDTACNVRMFFSKIFAVYESFQISNAGREKQKKIKSFKSNLELNYSQSRHKSNSINAKVC